MRETKNSNWVVDDKGQLRVLTDTWRKAEWRECRFCGKQFAFPINQSRQDRGLYCNIDCLGRWKRKINAQRRTGKRCPICMEFFAIKPSQAGRYKTCGEPDCVLAHKRQRMLAYWQRQRAGKVE